MILMREVMAAARRGGWALRLVQHAVVAVAHAQRVLERLDVDVRGLGLHRAGDDLVDQPDHRRLAGQVLQPLGILLQRIAPGFAIAVARGGVLGGAQPVQRRLQLDRHRHLDAHRQAGGGGDGIGGEAVERVGQRHHQRAVLDRRAAGRGRCAGSAA